MRDCRDPLRRQPKHWYSLLVRLRMLEVTVKGKKDGDYAVQE